MKTMLKNFADSSLSRKQMKSLKGGNCTDTYYNCLDKCPSSGTAGWQCRLGCYGDFSTNCYQE